MNSKEFANIKSELRPLLKNRNILDVIIFGSVVKGKKFPRDIDLAVICRDKKIPLAIKDERFHISILNSEDFFIKPIPLINSLMREGYSLRHKKTFSEVFSFISKVMFIYELKNLSNSKKVKISNLLHGKSSEDGLVKKYNGKWLSRQVFIVPSKNENIFGDLFSEFNIKYNKSYVLIH